MLRTVLTTCPFCASGCGLYLQAKDGELIGVTASENHPVSRGKLCARGWAAHEACLWGERLTAPMIRRNGTLQPVSWEDAIQHVVREISTLKAGAKPLAVLGSARATNEENYLTARLARAALHTGNVDFSLRVAYEPLLAGIADVLGGLPPPIGLDDIENAGVILLVEGDLARSHPRAAYSVIRAVKKGARLVTIGAVATQISRLAAIHLPAAPGAQSETINGLLAAIIASSPQGQRVDQSQVEGYESLRHAVASNPTRTQPLEEVGRWLAGAQRAAVLLAPTGAPPDQARQDAAALTSALAITDHLDRAGSGLLPLVGRSNFLGALDMGIHPSCLPGHRPLNDQNGLWRLEAVWGAGAAVTPGLDAQTMLGSVAGLIVVGDDPCLTLPGKHEALAAMRELDFMVVLDAFGSRAAELAHVVLPIAGFAETEGTYTNMTGDVQRVRAAVAPPGEAREGWKVLSELIAALGGSAYATAADVFLEISRVVRPYAGMTHSSLDQAWAARRTVAPVEGEPSLRAALMGRQTSDRFPLLLVRDPALDWGSDPLVKFSPILCRDYVSRSKLFPHGVVEMAKDDADALGVRHGWQVSITSEHGTAVLPVALRTDLQRGVALVPFALEEQAAKVFGSESITAVCIEKT